jgi:hypothetical protein
MMIALSGDWKGQNAIEAKNSAPHNPLMNREIPVPVIGKILIVIGIVFVVVGVLFVFADKIPYLGRLPGDIYIKNGKFSVYFPLTTCIIISIILTIIVSFLRK